GRVRHDRRAADRARRRLSRPIRLSGPRCSGNRVGRHVRLTCHRGVKEGNTMPRYDAERGTLVFGPGERLSRRTLLALAAGTAGSVAIGFPADTAVASGRPTAQAHDARFQETPKKGGQLRIGYVEPTSLDPQYHFSSLGGNIVGMIHNSPLTQDPNTSD